MHTIFLRENSICCTAHTAQNDYWFKIISRNISFVCSVAFLFFLFFTGDIECYSSFLIACLYINSLYEVVFQKNYFSLSISTDIWVSFCLFPSVPEAGMNCHCLSNPFSLSAAWPPLIMITRLGAEVRIHLCCRSVYLPPNNVLGQWAKRQTASPCFWEQFTSNSA